MQESFAGATKTARRQSVVVNAAVALLVSTLSFVSSTTLKHSPFLNYPNLNPFRNLQHGELWSQWRRLGDREAGDVSVGESWKREGGANCACCFFC